MVTLARAGMVVAALALFAGLAACSGCGASGGADPAGAGTSAGLSAGATTGAATAGAATAGGTTTGGTTTGGTTTGGTTTGGTTSGAPTTGAATTGGTTGTASFDGTRAFTLLQAQCALGPRPMGSAAHGQMLQWLVDQLSPDVDSVPYTQTFTYKSPLTGQTFPVTNVIGRINASAPVQVLLAAHWDTRSFADQDPVPANRSLPIPGANDGASEVAVLLELARVFHANRPAVGVEYVFFDGEDYAPVPGNYDEMYLGSKYFAQHLTDPRNEQSMRPTYGILLDMIGDKDLGILEEPNSVQRAPQIVSKVWNAAASIGDGNYFVPNLMPGAVEDDHLPLLDVGIPTIDCIDFEYETFSDPRFQYWHTLQDTPDKCSAHSLQVVGDVMSKVIYSETNTRARHRSVSPPKASPHHHSPVQPGSKG